MDIMHTLGLLFYFSGFFGFIFSRGHFLIMLLSLEFITLSIFFSMYILICYQVSNMFFLMIYLTLGVCEGVLGLSVMVMCIRSVGNEYIMSLNSLW